MKLINLLIFVFVIFFYKFSLAQNIVVIDIQFLIDNNEKYTIKIEEIEKNQQKYLDNFLVQENELSDILKNIEESKLILSQNEISIQIDEYNKKVAEFSSLVEKFNSHYQNEVIMVREFLLKEIIKLLEKYAIENEIDLILDASSYLIASNSLDITEKIKRELQKLDFKLEHKDFEKN